MMTLRPSVAGGSSSYRDRGLRGANWYPPAAKTFVVVAEDPLRLAVEQRLVDLGLVRDGELTCRPAPAKPTPRECPAASACAEAEKQCRSSAARLRPQ